MRSEALAAHLAAGARTAFAAGAHDCSLWPADWVLAARGFDPAAAWRRAYRSPHGFVRLIAEAGSLFVLWEAGIAGRLARTETPRPGDVGLVQLPGHRPTGAILARHGWAVLTPRGLAVASFPILAAWEV